MTSSPDRRWTTSDVDEHWTKWGTFIALNDIHPEKIVDPILAHRWGVLRMKMREFELLEEETVDYLADLQDMDRVDEQIQFGIDDA